MPGGFYPRRHIQAYSWPLSRFYPDPGTYIAQKWFVAALSADQTANLAVGNHIQLNSSAGVGGIASLSSGTGQDLGLVTLNAGAIYLLEGYIFANMTAKDHELTLNLQEHPGNTTVSTIAGVASMTLTMSSPSNSGGNPDDCPTNTLLAVVDCRAASKVVKLQKTAQTFGSQNNWGLGTRLLVSRLQ